MIKQTITILCCLFAAVVDYAQGIQFNDNLSWNNILAKAKSENRYVFIDAYATWCGPCKAMAEETFSNSDVGEVINANFIPVKVQMDRTGKDNDYVKSWYRDAEKLAKESALTAYPTLLFYSPQGNLVHKTVGYKDAEALIGEAKKALNPDAQYFTLIEKYKVGKMDTAQIKAFAREAKQMGDNATATMVAQGFIKMIPKKDLYTKENVQFISSYLTGSADKHFNIFLKNGKKVNQVLGKNAAENVVMGVVAKEEVEPYVKDKSPDWAAIENKATAKYGALGTERVAGLKALYYLDNKDWINYGQAYKQYFDLAIPHERSFLHINNLSWPIFEHVTDKDILATAVKAMKYDLEKFDGNDAAAIDTYANLLYKTGNKAEAIRWEEKAVKLSYNEKSMVETLEKMKKDIPTWE